jgi:hypothetical protein
LQLAPSRTDLSACYFPANLPLPSSQAMYSVVVDKRGSVAPRWSSGLRALKDQLPPEVRCM